MRDPKSAFPPLTGIAVQKRRSGKLQISGENQHLNPALPSWQKLQQAAALNGIFKKDVMGEVPQIATYSPRRTEASKHYAFTEHGFPAKIADGTAIISLLGKRLREGNTIGVEKSRRRYDHYKHFYPEG